MTIKEIQSRKECQTFDCKSIQIAPKSLAIPIVAMANVDGGVLAIGVSDRTRRFGEGIDRICNELETKGCAILSFHIDAFILKAILMAEWTTEKEFDRSSTATKDNRKNVKVSDTKLTDRQREIYETIKSGTINDQVNVPNLATLLGVSEKTMRRNLYVLRDMNLIHYVGSDKTGHWEETKLINKIHTYQ